MFTLRLEGLNKAVNDIQKFGAKKQGEIVRELDRTALMIESGAKKNLSTNGSVITGRLRSGTVRQATGLLQRSVGTNINYAPHVEFGTRPHVIYPRTAKALKTPYGFFRKVNHPGSKAKPFLFPAAEAERSNFIKNLTAILSRP